MDDSQKLLALQLRLDRLEEAVLGLSKRLSTIATHTSTTAPGASISGEPNTRAVKPTALVSDAERAGNTAFLDTSPSGLNSGDKPQAVSSPPVHPKSTRQATTSSDLSVTQVMGWTGVTLLVLAAAYLIRLIYDIGWLTPNRQLALAVLVGLALVIAGLKLRGADNNYASLLPAGGVVVFFLSIYGAHLYYHLVGPGLATAAVICNCLLAMWLGRFFASEIFGLFAVVGSYSAPLLLPTLSKSVVELAIYFSAWSLVFSWYSVAIGNRRPYLLAGYMALLTFQHQFQSMEGSVWFAEVVFQLLQFVVFLFAALVFSVSHKRTMTQSEAMAHLPLLLLFYALQFGLLHQHVPAAAPWVAISSAAVLMLGHWVAKRMLNISLGASSLLVGGYCALVLFHAVYLELVPEPWAPWIILLALPLMAFIGAKAEVESQLLSPFQWVLAALFFFNFARVAIYQSSDVVGSPIAVSFLYAIELYAAYFLGRSVFALRQWLGIALYAAHVGMMGAILRTVDSALAVSVIWAVLAIGSLMLAFRTNDQALGKSSLLVFAASLVKVILFDLAGAAPLVHIGSLVVVGASLYAGGLLYKRVQALDA